MGGTGRGGSVSSPVRAGFEGSYLGDRTRLPVAERFPVPRALFNEGVKRYGFHGLSYEYVARQLPDLLGEEKARGGIVIAHLGNGASMCALRDGLSRDTSMGFTAVDGLMMGTRTGSLDPGVILHLVEQKGMDAKALSNLIYKQSGLLGVSGISQDMRVLLESDEDSAREAVELFCYRAACMVGQLSMASGGLEALVFTGGIGEHAAPIRARIAEWLAWTGLSLYPAANQRHATRVHTKDSKVEVLVVPTNEEWMIGHHAVKHEADASYVDQQPRGESARPRLNSATRLETQRTRGNWTRLPSKAAPDTASPR